MNKKLVAKILGIILACEALCLLIPMVIGLLCGDHRGGISHYQIRLPAAKILHAVQPDGIVGIQIAEFKREYGCTPTQFRSKTEE